MQKYSVKKSIDVKISKKKIKLQSTFTPNISFISKKTISKFNFSDRYPLKESDDANYIYIKKNFNKELLRPNVPQKGIDT